MEYYTLEQVVNKLGTQHKQKIEDYLDLELFELMQAMKDSREKWRIIGQDANMELVTVYPHPIIAVDYTFVGIEYKPYEYQMESLPSLLAERKQYYDEITSKPCKQKATRITKKDAVVIVELFQTGSYTVQELADKFTTQPYTIKHKLRNAGIKFTRNGTLQSA